MAESDAFYLELVTTVEEALREFGASYSVRGPGIYNSETMTREPRAPREVMGLVSTDQVTAQLAQAVGTWIGRKSILLAPSANPKEDEEIQFEGEWFSLSKIEAVKPADIVVIYTLDVTR